MDFYPHPTKVFDHNHTAAMKSALDKCWGALEFAFPQGSSFAHLARDRLASAILMVAHEGYREPQDICDRALRLLLPVAANQNADLTDATPELMRVAYEEAAQRSHAAVPALDLKER